MANCLRLKMHVNLTRIQVVTMCKSHRLLEGYFGRPTQREYTSCRIWASQLRRPPYVTDVEGRARTEGVAASIHESYMDAHGNKIAEDAVFKSPCVVIIFDEAPRYREVQSKYESKHPIMETYRDRSSSVVETQIHAHTTIATRSRTCSGS